MSSKASTMQMSGTAMQAVQTMRMPAFMGSTPNAGPNRANR